MKTRIKNLFLLPALLAGLNLIPMVPVLGQTCTTLHFFALPFAGNTNNEGVNPAAGLVLSSNILYGTAELGGSWGHGAVFAVNTEGTGYTNLYSFTTGSGNFPIINDDGASPQAGLILSGTALYGTAWQGGSSGSGTVFKLNTNGIGFTNLHSFTPRSGSLLSNSDGALPVAGLVLSDNTLYGTASGGGTNGSGTVFAINTDGTGFTNLYSFTTVSGSYSNSDGAYPAAGLILSENTLYGTTRRGGSSGNGTVFAINTDGTGFTNLYSFTTVSGSYSNSDGAYPAAGLILSENTLYGTTYRGGSSGNGTVFAINTDGTGFTNLHSLTGNSDGANPAAGLILLGNTLYGTAYGGGSWGNGTVFAVNTDSSGFANLHSFTTLAGNSDGANPEAGLILSGNTLYGTTSEAGGGHHGTVFSLSFAPQLTIIPSGANVILTWPTNNAGFDYTGYTLQSTTNLVSPAVWSTASPEPVVVNGQNTVTNPISDSQKFYRLSQ